MRGCFRPRSRRRRYACAPSQTCSRESMARHRRLWQLHLEDHEILASKRDFRADEIHLPHTVKPLIINRSDAVAVALESRPPRSQSLGIMQAQDLDIGNP